MAPSLPHSPNWDLHEHAVAEARNPSHSSVQCIALTKKYTRQPLDYRKAKEQLSEAGIDSEVIQVGNVADPVLAIMYEENDAASVLAVIKQVGRKLLMLPIYPDSLAAAMENGAIKRWRFKS